MKHAMRRTIVAIAAWTVAVPQAVWAHDGHAGPHGWLAGALQPLLGVDHFVAALIVAATLSAGLTAVALRVRRARSA